MLTRSRLSTGYTRLFRDVYVSRDDEVTAVLRARAGWLWSGRRAVVAGFSAAALHGSKWVDAMTVVDLIHHNRYRQPGIRVHGDRIEEDEITVVDGILVTSAARTALDLGCWYPTTAAVAGIDALARETRIKAADVELLAQRYPGRRGIVRAREAIALFDGGSQSPKESWLRVVLTQAGLPPPQTQIRVVDDLGDPVAYLDMGWEDLKVAVEYDGDHHRSDRRQYGWDIRRSEMLQRLGWIVVRVVAGDRPADIIARVREARARRT
ncbi:DUF559 domain-containing protein [Mycobacterium avium subsp. paratuberculosis]|nr:hypothetical protein B0172_02742 [Mycobacterium avium subsp. paratuberculosis]OVF04086.1 hypothetical protein B0173_01798 [Mycobacterium avium subsp. paratuberculosis]QKU46785.1 protein of unknown function (DUF4095) [Mycobacterium avium subsp. paratuberculosis]CAG6865523.1 DUF559 domain-containing protein [Mycobacterium avium subsp. paratuberculosis]CAG6867370.1 DUF559 domain-containing protein [Mycobacterium avium subsp. paratuberculosis]